MEEDLVQAEVLIAPYGPRASAILDAMAGSFPEVAEYDEEKLLQFFADMLSAVLLVAHEGAGIPQDDLHKMVGIGYRSMESGGRLQ